MNIADKLTQIAENEQKVYDAGYEAGRADADDSEEAYNQGVEDGKYAEWNAFWYVFQFRDGKLRTTYEYGFQAWRGSSFKPKYDLVLSGPYNTKSFRQAQGFDLYDMTVGRGVAFDTSGATTLNAVFNQSAIGKIPPLDLSSCTSMPSTFSAMGRMSGYTTTDIVLNNLREDCTFNKTFDNAPNLENIMITGTIGQNGFDVISCTKLSKASIESIINALSDTATGKTLTLSKTAVRNAFKKKYKVGIAESVNADGYRDVYLPSETLRSPRFEFSSLMDVVIYYGHIEEDEWGGVDVYWDDFPSDGETGVSSFGVLMDTDNMMYRYAIRRTDGKEISENDVVLIDDDLGDWDALVATKPNWTISLV